MAYIEIETGNYPISEAEIRGKYPNTTFPKPFKKDGFEVVFETPKPVCGILETVIESAPILTLKGTWEQAWSITDKFQDIPGGPTKAEQEQEFLAQEFTREKQNIIAKINAQFARETAQIKGQVMQGEVDTFNTQEKEALGFTADNTYPTPLLCDLAAVRGLDVAELAARVLDHAEAYKHAIGLVMGKKHALEDQLDGAMTIDDLKLIEVK